MPTLAAAAEAPAIMLSQTRIIRASRPRVYEAWTNPDVLKQWFGPEGMYCPNASLDVRVGGAYSMESQPTSEVLAADPACANRGGVAAGTYTKVIPNELLQFTWRPSWNPGEESLVTVSLKDVAEGTEITIVHERFSSEGSRQGHAKGWAGCLDKLTQTLEA
jgi:uncharacterized protein YndB with AHSA1/START domain